MDKCKVTYMFEHSSHPFQKNLKAFFWKSMLIVTENFCVAQFYYTVQMVERWLRWLKHHLKQKIFEKDVIEAVVNMSVGHNNALGQSFFRSFKDEVVLKSIVNSFWSLLWAVVTIWRKIFASMDSVPDISFV